MNYVIIDSGGTATKCFYYDNKGSLLGQQLVEPFIPLRSHKQHNIGVLRDINDNFVSPLQIDLARTKWIFSLAGLYSESEFVFFEHQILEVFKLPHYQMISDIIFAYFQNIPLQYENGLLVLSGTGSIIFGRNKAHQFHRTDGWGPLLGDIGSGYFVGIEALKMLTRVHDGYCEEDAFTQTLLEKMELGSIKQLTSFLANINFDRKFIASLTHIVFDFYEKGNPYAQLIVEKLVTNLSESALNTCSKLFAARTPFAVSFAGGLLTHQHKISQSVFERIKKSYVDCIYLQPTLTFFSAVEALIQIPEKFIGPLTLKQPYGY